MGEQLEAVVELTNDKVRFTGVTRDNPAVVFDYKPPIGDGQGYTSLEMVLMSFATCSGTALAHLLRKMRRTVKGLKVQAKGIRQETLPLAIKQIYVEYLITSPDATEAEVQKALRMAEENSCPVWAMLKGNVEISATYKITA